MGKSIRSKRMRRNRRIIRARNGPKETEKLKQAIAFEINELTEKAHLSMFHDVMNGPPPMVPGLEPGSNLARAHLTEGHAVAEKIDDLMVFRKNRILETAARAIDKTAPKKKYPHPRERDSDEEEDAMDDKEEKEPRVFNPRTKRDQFGNYPVWMNKKTVKALSRAGRLQRAKDKRINRRRQSRVVSNKGVDVEMEEDKGASSEEEMQLHYR